MRLLSNLALELSAALLVTALLSFCAEWLKWKFLDNRKYYIGVAILILASPAMVFALQAFIGAFKVLNEFFSGPAHLFVPLVFAGPVLLLSDALFRPLRAAHSLGWRVAVHIWFLGYLTLNLINWCQPGWCGWFGFPFTFLRFSDGRMLSADPASPFSPLAAFGNVLLFLSVVVGLAIAHHRSQSEPAPNQRVERTSARSTTTQS